MTNHSSTTSTITSDHLRVHHGNTDDAVDTAWAALRPAALSALEELKKNKFQFGGELVIVLDVVHKGPR